MGGRVRRTIAGAFVPVSAALAMQCAHGRPGSELNADARTWARPEHNDTRVGFRVARTLPWGRGEGNAGTASLEMVDDLHADGAPSSLTIRPSCRYLLQ